MKLGIFTDCHASTKEISVRTRRPSLSKGKIREAIAAFQRAGCDAVICLGDLADAFGTYEENAQFLRELAEIISALSVPFYCVLGNHDCENFEKEEFYKIAGWKTPPAYVDFGDCRLVFLDACYHSNGGAYSPAGVNWKDCFLPPKGVEALQHALDTAGTQKIHVFLHQCLDPMIDARHILQNAEEIRTMLQSAPNVCGVHQGHCHWGGENIAEGIPYHTYPAMCEGEENRYFVVEI